jgi:hypothetical protein
VTQVDALSVAGEDVIQAAVLFEVGGHSQLGARFGIAMIDGLFGQDRTVVRVNPQQVDAAIQERGTTGGTEQFRLACFRVGLDQHTTVNRPDGFQTIKRADLSRFRGGPQTPDELSIAGRNAIDKAIRAAEVDASRVPCRRRIDTTDGLIRPDQVAGLGAQCKHCVGVFVAGEDHPLAGRCLGNGSSQVL